MAALPGYISGPAKPDYFPSGQQGGMNRPATYTDPATGQKRPPTLPIGVIGQQGYRGPMRPGDPTMGSYGLLKGGASAMPLPGGQQSDSPTGNSPLPNSPTTPTTPQQPQMPGVGSVTTSITPNPIYTPQMTQQAVNRSVAEYQAQADPRYAAKGFSGGGRSMDAGMLSAAAPMMGQAMAGAQAARAGIPLEDLFANQRNLLSGEMARENEALGLSSLLARINSANEQNRISNQNDLWSLFYGPLMQMLG